MTPLPAGQLEEMIEQATVDCYNDSEQAFGLFTLLEDALAMPFETTVLGAPVTVTKVDLTADDQIVAHVRRGGGGGRQRIPLLDLPLPNPAPAGWEWIVAYRHWASRSGGA